MASGPQPKFFRLAMANIRDITATHPSAKNIQQITRAMKFVSAARLRQSPGTRFIAARPYASRCLAVLNSLATAGSRAIPPPAGRARNEKIELVVITADRGLCGAYNTNIIRQASNSWTSISDRQVVLNILANEPETFPAPTPIPVRYEAIDVLQKPSFCGCGCNCQRLTTNSERAKVRYWACPITSSKSVVQQRVVVERCCR